MRLNLSRALLGLGWWSGYVAIQGHAGLVSLFQLCVLIYLFGLAFHNVGAPLPVVLRQLWREPSAMVIPALAPLLVLGLSLLLSGRWTGMVCLGAMALIAWLARSEIAAQAPPSASSLPQPEPLSQETSSCR